MGCRKGYPAVFPLGGGRNTSWRGRSRLASVFECQYCLSRRIRRGKNPFRPSTRISCAGLSMRPVHGKPVRQAGPSRVSARLGAPPNGILAQLVPNPTSTALPERGAAMRLSRPCLPVLCPSLLLKGCGPKGDPAAQAQSSGVIDLSGVTPTGTRTCRRRSGSLFFRPSTATRCGTTRRG